MTKIIYIILVLMNEVNVQNTDYLFISKQECEEQIKYLKEREFYGGSKIVCGEIAYKEVV